MYPNEFHVVPKEEVLRLDRERLERHARIFPMSKRGPEERAYKPMPQWAWMACGAGLALTSSGILYVVYAVAGINGVIAMLVCFLLLGVAISLPIIAATDEPKR